MVSWNLPVGDFSVNPYVLNVKNSNFCKKCQQAVEEAIEVGYRSMIDTSAAQRTGTSDEIAEAAAFLLGEHAKFITGNDLLEPC